MRHIFSDEHEFFDPSRWIVYMGSKRKLLTRIHKAISDCAKPPAHILDLFSGSGIVAGYLRHKGYEVHANDIATYSFIINQAYLENTPDTIINLSIPNTLKYLNSLSTPVKDVYFAKHFSEIPDQGVTRLFYTLENANFIDAVLEKIPSYNNKVHNIVSSELLYRMSRQANTGGVFIPYNEIGSKAKANMHDITQKINLQPPVVPNTVLGKSFQSDAIRFLESCNQYDVIYIDPPYNTRQYANYYHLLEYACLPFKNRYIPEPSQKTGVDPTMYKSPFSKSNCVAAFEKLFELVFMRTNNAILSYNEDGSLHINQLKQILSRFANVEVITVPYRKYTGISKTKEFILIARTLSNKKLFGG